MAYALAQVSPVSEGRSIASFWTPFDRCATKTARSSRHAGHSRQKPVPGSDLLLVANPKYASWLHPSLLAVADDNHIDVGNRLQQTFEDRLTQPAAIPGALRAAHHEVRDAVFLGKSRDRLDDVGSLRTASGVPPICWVKVSMLVICRCVAASIRCASSVGVLT